VKQRLSTHGSWSIKLLKLECEQYNLYQNETGTIVDGLIDTSPLTEISHQVIGNKHWFIVSLGTSSVRGTEVFDKTRDILSFISDSGDFANLVAYIALCKIRTELRGNFHIDVLPEGGHFHMIHDSEGREPDALVSLPMEYVPIEVYNGMDYLSQNTRKYNQVTDMASDNSDEANNYPLLINRRSDDDVKKGVRHRNGMVVDTDWILSSEDLYTDCQDAIDFFNLDRLIYEIPPLQVANGDYFDGSDYSGLSQDYDAAQCLRPPSSMTADIDELPSQYVQRIRGGVHLQYVNSIYRRSTDPVRSNACFVLQTIYNQLLRQGGKPVSTAVADGWQGAQSTYTNIKTAERRGGREKSLILDAVDSLIDKLRREDIIFSRNGNLYARTSKHPQLPLIY